MSSSSQRRPRAIAATNLARVSERIGRTCSGRIPSGSLVIQLGLDRLKEVLINNGRLLTFEDFTLEGDVTQQVVLD